MILDVTAVRSLLEADGRWDDGAVRVSFVPVPPADDDEAGDGDDLEGTSPPDAHARRLALVTAPTG